jgi:hypothetical protein
LDKEIIMRSLLLLAAAAIILGVAGIPATAFTGAGLPVVKAAPNDVTPVASRRRPFYNVRVPRYQQARVPRHLRGFQDPGYAYHGNINGCVVDLGYGRWESCNVGR